jgi:Fur family peroxide stress response transcriptional regulator
MKTNSSDPAFAAGMARHGLRSTPQREHVYRILLQERDHPTAEQVFMRAKRRMPEISLATVYNCLEALVQCDLVRLVRVQRGPSRFCPNMRKHGHFHCERCGRMFDVDLTDGSAWAIPGGFRVASCEVTLRGECGECARMDGSEN